MAVISEIIVANPGGSLSFGDYSVSEKKKVNDYEVDGDIYKIKTHDQVTRLEKNGKLFLETVPGATIHNLSMDDRLVCFEAEGRDDTMITLELEPEMGYVMRIDGKEVGDIVSSMSGKVNFSMELTSAPQTVRIQKKGE